MINNVERDKWRTKEEKKKKKRGIRKRRRSKKEEKSRTHCVSLYEIIRVQVGRKERERDVKREGDRERET